MPWRQSLVTIVERPLPSQNIENRAGRADGEHNYRNPIIARKRDGGGVHDAQIAGQNIVKGEPVEALGLRVALGIGGIDAIDAGALEERVAAHLRGPQRGARYRS